MAVDVAITKTAFDRCEPVGKALVKKAEAERDYRKQWANKEIGQACKDGAQYIANRARGSISVIMNIDDERYAHIFGRKRC